MRKQYVKFMAAGVLILVFMVGCGNGNTIDRVNGTVSEDADGSEYDAGEQESRNDTEPEQPEESKNSRSPSQPQSTPTAEELEKEMAAYRAEREKGTSSFGNYTLEKAPSEENYMYGIGASDDGATRYDTRELTEAFKTARVYVEETLKLESEVYECIDPRMLAIYEDEDKGVANGYDSGNIFLCEYEDHGKWQYLILVREGKGSDWKVLYHGSSYKTEKNEGGDKK